jgi:hypothetical protein
MIKQKYSFFHRNGLSVVLIALFIVSLTGQYIAGWKDKNEELKENNFPPLSFPEYGKSGHFIQATFENWESEFLQMAVFVLLTVSLRQKGSAESKALEGEEDSDREPRVHSRAPWPVKKGGIWLKFYSHSLSITLTLIFVFSFTMHLYGSLRNSNDEKKEKMLPPEKWTEYIVEPRFWFESFQNWQSEFLSIAAIVLLSVWLREKGSSQSKPVDAANDENS